MISNAASPRIRACNHQRPLVVRLLAFWLSLALAPAMFASGAGAPARAETPRHGLSAFGDLKYPADFTHFEYVNPDAPKGGRLSRIGTAGLTTFDSFNAFILRGDAAQGLSLVFDTLMAPADDEPDSVYGLVAHQASVAADRRSVIFEMRPEARFADGSPVTSADVVFSFETLKTKGHPNYRTLLRDVVAAEALGPHSVRFMFEGETLRDLPTTVATLPILSKAFYATREFDQTTLEPPLGSGPYAVAEFRQGSFVTYRRRADYWGAELPVNRGRWNFDEVRFEYFRDRTAELEALKAGTFDLREEFTSKDWATGYDIPQVREGRLVLTTLPDARPSGAQGYFINTRRSKFADARVREALGLAFDFEWTNANLFYDLYKRTASYFENSELKATGLPSEAELAVLEAFRDQLPASIFTEPAVEPPVSDGSGSDRRLLRRAIELLEAAGWQARGRQRVNAAGEVLEVEILDNSPSFDRVHQPYLRNLERIGVVATVRRVDAAQYERRVKSFDFDLTPRRYVFGRTPGLNLLSYIGSDAADQEGSFNLSGIRNPVIDALVEQAVVAGSREELTTVVRALDRVLRTGHYWVPHWYKASHNIAHWNRFSWPDIKPRYADGVNDTWWFDAAKAASITR